MTYYIAAYIYAWQIEVDGYACDNEYWNNGDPCLTDS